MSFSMTTIENIPYLSKEANEVIRAQFLKVFPTEKYLSSLPLPQNLRIEPFWSHQETSVFWQAILDFEVRSDDVFVCSLIKCGSSWLQTIVWLLTHNLDYETNQTLDRSKQVGDFDHVVSTREAQKRLDELMNDKNRSIDKTAAIKKAWNDGWTLESPRVIKTHNPVYFLPNGIWSKGTKVIYICRNPKDMIVSEYHFMRNFFHTKFTIDDMINGITSNQWYFSPRFDHVLNYWNVRHLPNVLFVTYEDLVTDSFTSIKKISEFLDCNYTDAQLKELADYVSFEKMSSNKAINREVDMQMMEKNLGQRPDSNYRFLRKGKVGSYRDDLNEDQIKKLDDWIEKNQKGTDFKFKEVEI